MDFEKLKIILANQPAFRLKQAYMAIFKELRSAWSEVSTLPAGLRQELDRECPLAINAQIETTDDSRSAKAVITLADGEKIESVLMKHANGRNTVCVSSQVGCPLGCTFCATGQRGFSRNVTADEIVEQVLLFSRLLAKDDERVGSIVFMGMGEPFLNYDSVLEAIRKINDPDRLGIGARHISISTAGIVPGIERLTKEPLQVNLAVSLHAPTDELRRKIMPIGERYGIKEVLNATSNYIKKTNRRVMIEYVMLAGQNDTPDHAKKLAELLHGKLPPLFFVNVIVYNPTGFYQSSSSEAVSQFLSILEKYGITAVERFRFARGVKGACGQLAGRKK
ncbi:MAG: 23S rRNA (adenine(2503)-C(2))-methyltransferase RlmN [Patescibacteria group bacterium]